MHRSVKPSRALVTTQRCATILNPLQKKKNHILLSSDSKTDEKTSKKTTEMVTVHSLYNEANAYNTMRPLPTLVRTTNGSGKKPPCFGSGS